MSNLVTDSDVKGIMDTDISDLTPFIDTAHTDVQELSYDEERKTKIELWLSAHFVELQEKELDSKTVEGNKESYGWEKGKGYEATRYGQTALALDRGSELSGGEEKDVHFKHTG